LNECKDILIQYSTNYKDRILPPSQVIRVLKEITAILSSSHHIYIDVRVEFSS